MGISRASLYYVSRQLPKDWSLKNRIEEVLREHPGYGSPRVAPALGVIHRTIWIYNHTRIHSVLKMPPFLFADRYQKLLETVS